MPETRTHALTSQPRSAQHECLGFHHVIANVSAIHDLRARGGMTWCDDIQFDHWRCGFVLGPEHRWASWL